MTAHDAGMARDAGAPHRPRRVLFVFAWLVVGGEETEVRLLARLLDPARYRIEVLACHRRAGMPDQTERQLAELGIAVDRTAYGRPFAEAVEHLARRIGEFDLVVATQAAREVAPAFALATARGWPTPPLIEHGGLVDEAERLSPIVARYVGVCDSIRAAAAARLPGREHHAIEIPSMVDLDEFDAADRWVARAELGLDARAFAVGWVGRLDRKKRVEDVIRAAAATRTRLPEARFVIVGGPDAFMPEYEGELRALAADRGVDGIVTFLGDRPDVPRLLAGFDAYLWLSRGEGMPHVIAEAGAAGLPVVATADNGTLQQIEDGVSGLFVPHEDPPAIAGALIRLAGDPALRARLGAALWTRVRSTYAADVVVPHWHALFDEVLAERPATNRRAIPAR